MDLFGFLELIGGLSLFLFGMSLMEQVLKKCGQQAEGLAGAFDVEKAEWFFDGSGGDRHHTKLFSYYSYGGWVRKLRYNDPKASDTRYHGSKRRYDVTAWI